MKKQIAVLILMLLLSACLTGCSNKQIPGGKENANMGFIETGRYIGSLYTVYSSFMPVLSLEESCTFTLELGINKSIEGTYASEDNKLILTSDDGNESYTFEIKEYGLIIEQEIPGYVKENTNFKLMEQKN